MRDTPSYGTPVGERGRVGRRRRGQESVVVVVVLSGGRTLHQAHVEADPAHGTRGSCEQVGRSATVE